MTLGPEGLFRFYRGFYRLFFSLRLIPFEGDGYHRQINVYVLCYIYFTNSCVFYFIG